MLPLLVDEIHDDVRDKDDELRAVLNNRRDDILSLDFHKSHTLIV